MSTLRVLHVAQPVEAGVPEVLLRYVRAQCAAGDEVHVAAPGPPLLDRAAARGAQVHPWPATRAPGPGTLREARALRRIVADLRPDVVHLHSAKAGLAGRLAVRGRTATVFQPHAWSFDAVTGPVARAALAWERSATRWTHLTVCVGEQERTVGRAHGVEGPMVVVANDVDPARFPPVRPHDRSRARGRLGLEGRAPVAVCVGRLAEQKGQDVLLDLWREVVAAVPAATLHLVGDGPVRAGLTGRAASLRGVSLAGPAADVRDWYLAADVVLVPSRWEGLAVVPLEAQACARCVVASTATGLAETVTRGTGVVLPLSDRAAWVAAVVARLGDRALADQEGAQARASSERRWRTAADPTLHAVYASVRS